jgi:hypothetical protein
MVEAKDENGIPVSDGGGTYNKVYAVTAEVGNKKLNIQIDRIVYDRGEDMIGISGKLGKVLGNGFNKLQPAGISLKEKPEIIDGIVQKVIDGGDFEYSGKIMGIEGKLKFKEVQSF